MNSSKIKGRGAAAWCSARPVAAGLLLACAVTALLIAAFSLFFVVIESIADSAVVPLALLSAAAGCFVGAFLCGAMAKSRGLLFGAIVGGLVFVMISIVGVFCSESPFGTEMAIKLIILLAAGCAGGYLGANRKRKRKR